MRRSLYSKEDDYLMERFSLLYWETLIREEEINFLFYKCLSFLSDIVKVIDHSHSVFVGGSAHHPHGPFCESVQMMI